MKFNRPSIWTIPFLMNGILFTFLEGKEHFLSFIMPCYNCAITVQKSLDSIYAQEISIPFEVICTDDGSSDNTLQILMEYQKKHSNFYIYRHKNNKGGGAASNTCVKHAKGDLLFRLDSDNQLTDNTINRLVQLLISSGCDGASVQELRFFKQEGVKNSSWFFEPANNICNLQHCMTFINNPAHSGNYLFTRNSYDRAGGYPENHGSDTFCFGFKQYATGSEIAILPNSFYWHYHNDHGYWSREEKTGRNYRSAWDVFKQFNHIFSSKTTKWMRSTVSANPFRELERGRFILAPENILKQVFDGYKHEARGNHAHALYKFEQVVAAGFESKELKDKIKILRKLVS